MKWSRLALTCLAFLAGYLAWRAAREQERAAVWRIAATAAVTAGDSLTRQADSLLLRQAILTAELSFGLAEREAYRERSARLARALARMRADTLPPAPDTCGLWVGALTALNDTLTALAASEGTRADLAENAAQRADTGRRDALASLALLSGQLARADSLLRVTPRLTASYLSLLLDARIGSDGRLDGTAALRRGNVYAGVGDGPRIIVGYRRDLRIF